MVGFQTIFDDDNSKSLCIQIKQTQKQIHTKTEEKKICSISVFRSSTAATETADWEQTQPTKPLSLSILCLTENLTCRSCECETICRIGCIAEQSKCLKLADMLEICIFFLFLLNAGENEWNLLIERCVCCRKCILQLLWHLLFRIFLIAFNVCF